MNQLSDALRIKSFRSFNEERAKPVKSVVITFGRFNPPTVGHQKLLESVAKLADGNNYRIYASQSVDLKKNPLVYSEKLKFMRKLFPKMGRNIIEDQTVKNILGAASAVSKEGFTKLIVVVGSDRVAEFSTLLKKYNGSEQTNYNFVDGIEVVSAGERDPDSEDAVEGMSASKMRVAASRNDLISFSKGIPHGFAGTKELFNAVRSGMGLNESYSFRKHIQLREVSQTREEYVKGRIFNVGDLVELIEDSSVHAVTSRRPNYLIVTDKVSGVVTRKWLGAFRAVKPETT